MMTPIRPAVGHEKPEIFIEPEVYYKIMHMIWECDTEVNGLARVERVGNRYHINDVAVLKQYVSGGYAEHDTDALLDFMLEQGEDAPNWVCQWHSHVNMGVFWSSQDEEAVAAMGDTAEWTISIVFNKKQDYKCRIDLFKPIPVKEIDCKLTVNDEIPDFSEWAKERKAAVVFPHTTKPHRKFRGGTQRSLGDGSPSMIDQDQEGRGKKIAYSIKFRDGKLPIDQRSFLNFKEEEELKEYLGFSWQDMDSLFTDDEMMILAYKEMVKEMMGGAQEDGVIIMPSKRERVAIALGYSPLPDENGIIIGDFTDEDINQLSDRLNLEAEEATDNFQSSDIPPEFPVEATPWDNDVTATMWEEVCSHYGQTRKQLEDAGVDDAEISYIYYNELHPEFNQKVRVGKTAKKRVKQLKKKLNA